MRFRLTRRSLSAVAVAGAVVAALIAATPAHAEETLPTHGAGFEAAAQDLFGLDGLVSVGRDASGDFVVRIAPDAPATTSGAIEELAQRYGNVVSEVGRPFEAASGADVVGGAGALFETPDRQPVACTIGFSAWSPTGAPAVVTAGHCAEGTRAQVSRSVPSSDPAAGGPGLQTLDPLGTVGFHRFGGDPGNPAGADGDSASTDLAVVDLTGRALSPLPAVTDWTTAAGDDLSLSTLPVTALGPPVEGAPFVSSGVTSGLRTGGDLGITGWTQIDGRWVRGFEIDGLTSRRGDSGGPVLQGTTAVGIVSAFIEGTDLTWATDLTDGLALTGGYTLRFAVEAPVVLVPDGAGIVRGARISGTAPAGSAVTVTGDGGFITSTTAAGDGSWSFRTPQRTGSFSFGATATRGFDVSPVASRTVELIPSPVAPPVVTTPGTGTVSDAVTVISGTATPGYTVALSGAASGTTVTDAEGRWSLPVSLGAGEHTVAVVQSLDDIASDPVILTFRIATPAAPVTPAVSAASAASASAGELAATGADLLPGAAAGALLLVAGALLRRRSGVSRRPARCSR